MRDGCNQIMAACKDAGLDVVEPFGGYFILVDTSPLGLEFDTSQVRALLPIFPSLNQHRYLQIFIGFSRCFYLTASLDYVSLSVNIIFYAIILC